MPKWIDLNQVDDDDVLAKNNEKISRTYAEEDTMSAAALAAAAVTGANKPDAALQAALAVEREKEISRETTSTYALKKDTSRQSLRFAAENSSPYAEEDDFLDAMEPAKKSMTIFFLIDVSGSMKGTKIGSLNSTMEELLPSLIGVGEASTDVRIAVMKFSTQVEWVTPEPVRIEEYQFWNRLDAEGLTFMGDAFLELSRKLSRSSFLSSPSLSYAPVIFLLSDGSPNDDWKKGLETLRQNKWFQHGLKIALGIGSQVNMDVLREFTGNEELAVKAKNADQLRELIKLLAITSSQIGSRSLALVDTWERARTGEEMVAQAKQQVLVEEIRMGTKDILGEAVDLDAVNYDEGW